MDLEKELACSICTELLYNPLTLLDCLHTFCGACLKEWFEWQASAARSAPDPPAPGQSVFTCPSCRAGVRDTRHNSTVASLLDMVLVAHPEKAKPQNEKDEMDAKYKPGDKVLPVLKFPKRTAEQLRLEERERRLVDSVRDLSLREAVHGGSSSSSRSRRRGEDAGSQSRIARRRAPRETSASRENSSHEGRHRERTHRRRPTGEDTRRRLVRLSPESVDPQSEHSRNSSSVSQRTSDESFERHSRHIGHQTSLRSLISSSDAADIDIEREVEEFARQIQEEGLLDGLDLDNIDLTNNDELSRKITEAYRRRQRDRERLRNEALERSRASSQHSHTGPAEARSNVSAGSSRPARPTEQHSRTPSATSQSDERSRRALPPPSSSNTSHLDVHEQRWRRRTGSHSRDRSATVPVAPTQPELRVSGRAQTDLELRSNSMTSASRRPTVPDTRSVSTSDVPTQNNTPSISDSPQPISLPFSARASVLGLPHPQEHSSASPETRSTSTRSRPREIVTSLPDTQPEEAQAGSSRQAMGSVEEPQPTTVAPYVPKSPLFEEPSLSCNTCGKENIQYELHYNCRYCHNGDWNICLSCYRRSKGCLHWFGFGYGGFAKWERQRKFQPSLPEPHKLLASRFSRPKTIVASAAEDKQVWSTDDPYARLQSGTFCALCEAWTNDCYWWCDSCNEGDWGFCNDCVNQGRSCTHALLPLAHQAAVQQTVSPPPSPRSPSHPSSSTMVVGLNANSIGPFKVLTFITTCDMCQTAIAPTQSRLHCFSCVSSIVPDSRPGDYDICAGCYDNLVSDNVISAENGPAGWRRCPQGHRMVVVGFQEGKSGQKRHVLRDLVGGRRLRMEILPNDPSMQRWSWPEGGEEQQQQQQQQQRERLVTTDVGGTTAAPDSLLPPDGGFGWRALARWAWYPAPGANDELMFPKGAELTEVVDANGDWFLGVYMGRKGLFPAPYVSLREGSR